MTMRSPIRANSTDWAAETLCRRLNGKPGFGHDQSMRCNPRARSLYGHCVRD